jgi:TolA-binding protein
MHIGKVILGSVGTDDRLSTTVIGDPVNVAARLESFTKINKTDIQVSGELVVRIKEPQKFHLREVGYFDAKGKSNKIRLFEEYSGKPPDIIAKINANKSSFEMGIEYFDKGEYILARKEFETYLEAVPSDEVARYFLEKSLISVLH